MPPHLASESLKSSNCPCLCSQTRNYIKRTKCQTPFARDYIHIGRLYLLRLLWYHLVTQVVHWKWRWVQIHVQYRMPADLIGNTNFPTLQPPITHPLQHHQTRVNEPSVVSPRHKTSSPSRPPCPPHKTTRQKGPLHPVPLTFHSNSIGRWQNRRGWNNPTSLERTQRTDRKLHRRKVHTNRYSH